MKTTLIKADQTSIKDCRAKGFRRSSVLKLVTAASIFLLPACTGPQSTTTPSEESNVTTEELADEPASYEGKEVTVRGEVDKTVDETSFLIDDGNLFEGEGILVINATSEPFAIPDAGDSEVQVTGEVETFSSASTVEEYSLTLDPTLYADYENQPVIIAKSLALAPDPGDITANPEQYYNQRIAIEGKVDDIYEPDLFTLDEEKLFATEDLLVLSPGLTSADVKDDEIVAITGVLRPYVQADFDEDYDLQWDLSVKENIEAEYEQKPVFVADSIYPSAIPK